MKSGQGLETWADGSTFKGEYRRQSWDFRGGIFQNFQDFFWGWKRGIIFLNMCVVFFLDPWKKKTYLETGFLWSFNDKQWRWKELDCFWVGLGFGFHGFWMFFALPRPKCTARCGPTMLLFCKGRKEAWSWCIYLIWQLAGFSAIKLTNWSPKSLDANSYVSADDAFEKFLVAWSSVRCRMFPGLTLASLWMTACTGRTALCCAFVYFLLSFCWLYSCSILYWAIVPTHVPTAS